MMMKKILPFTAIAIAFICAVPVGLKIFSIYNISFWLAIFFHLLSASFFSVGFFFLTDRHKKRERRDNVWWIFVLITCFALPVYGIISALTIYSAQVWKGRRPPPVVSDEITVQDPEVFSKPITRARQLEILDRLDIEPFIDIFRRGQSDLKKSAVKLLSTMRSIKAIKTLRMALMDDDIEIRLFAAGVLGKIEDEFATEIKTKQTKFSLKPKDKKLALDLVNFYINYAESGLLDNIAKNYYYKETLKILNDLPKATDASYLKAKIYYILNNYDEAKKHIDYCIKEDGTKPDYHELLWSILFDSKDFGELSINIYKAKKAKIVGLNTEISEFWTR